MKRRLAFDKEEFAFVALLKDCAKKKDIHRGSKLHDDVLKRGLVEKSPYLASAIIHMYSKCGIPSKGLGVLENLLVPDVVSWNALIGGYAQLGQGHEAMKCFEQMRRKGLSPNAVTFICILKACGTVENIGIGKKIHDEIVNSGGCLLNENVKLGNALVDMYARCGLVSKAREVLEELPFQSVVSWNALIAGYTRHGQCYQAFNCFEQMQSEGLSPDAITFICILKACRNSKTIEKGKQIHETIMNRDLLAKNTVLGTALVDMYAKCGMPEKAHRVLEELPHRNVISWSTLIAGYVQEGYGDEALNCFERMLSEGLSPDAITFSSILKACSSTRAIEKGEQIHDKIVKEGFLKKDIVLGTALVDMYAKCDKIEKARRVLEELPFRDVVSWNALIAGYVQLGRCREALDCFDRMQNEGFSPDTVTYLSVLKACGSATAIGRAEKFHDEIKYRGFLKNDIVLGNALVDMYVKCGLLTKAQCVLEELPYRNVTSWNIVISGYAEHGQSHEALNCLEHMQSEGLSPDAITFICTLKACGTAGAIEKGKKIHDMIVSADLLENDLALGTALVDMYAKCGGLAKAQEVLERLDVRNVISWSALISGYAQQGQFDEALTCYERMESEGLSPNAVTFSCMLKVCGSTRAIDKGKQIHKEILERSLLEKEIVLGNALVDMYAKCGELLKAQQLLGELPNRDIVSWNTLITAYAECGQGHEALECFERMQSEGLSPNEVTLICILKACSCTGAIEKGKQIHKNIVRMGLLEKDILIGTALIDMYVKCGALSKAEEVLKELPIRSVISWNSLIAGYAQQGQGHEALNCLEKMQTDGLSPDEVTFLCVLSACSHSALMGEARRLFGNMERRYGISPNIEHHTCMISVLGSAGRFEEAMSVIKVIPDSDHSDLWLALLGACRKWGNVNLGSLAFDQTIQLDNTCASAYVLMANIFAAAGMQEDAERVEAMRLKYAACKEQENRLRLNAGGNVDSIYLGTHKRILGSTVI